MKKVFWYMAVWAVAITVMFFLPFLVTISNAQGEPSEIKLTEVEVLRGRVHGLEQQQLIDRHASIVKEIQPQLDQLKALEAKIKEYDGKLAEKEKAILAERKLDTAKFKVDWKAGAIVPQEASK